MAADEDINDVYMYREWAEVPNDVVRVRLHPSVTVITDKAFQGCTKLKEIEISDDGLVSIGICAFQNCTALKRIRFPPSLKTIHDFAFNNCKRLSRINIPSNVEHIGRRSFQYSDNVIKVRMPPLIDRVPVGMFGGCSSLFSVELHEGVTLINCIS